MTRLYYSVSDTARYITEGRLGKLNLLGFAFGTYLT